VSTPRKPDLDRLVTALTADGRPDELTGRDAAATAAFRAASQRTRPTGAARPRRVSMRRPRATLPQRLAAVGAVANRRRGGRRGGLHAGTARPGARTCAHRVRAARRPRQSAARSARPAARRHHRDVGRKVRASQLPVERPRHLRPGREPATSSPWPCPARACRPASGSRSPDGLPKYGHAAAGCGSGLFERLACSAQFELVAAG